LGSDLKKKPARRTLARPSVSPGAGAGPRLLTVDPEGPGDPWDVWTVQLSLLCKTPTSTNKTPFVKNNG